MKQLTAILAITILSSPLKLQADEQENLFESTRFYGRGRTFVAGFDTNEATRFNPATLSESDITFQLRPLELDLFVGKNTVDGITTLIETLSSSDKSEEGILSSTRDWFGNKANGRGQLSLLSMRFGAFELSLFGIASGFGDFRNPALPSIEFKMDTIAGASISYSFDITSTLSLGLTIRPLYRWYVGGEVGVIDAMDFPIFSLS